MLKSKTVNTLRDLALEGQSIRQISKDSGLSRNTVRKYLRSNPVAAARPPRTSKLDPYKDQVRRWVKDDRLLNCVTMLERLKPLGYTGSLTILKEYVSPLRPPKGGRRPVLRYETEPGEQMQIDWATFTYEADGVHRRIYGMTAVLSYSRMRYVVFSKRCDTASLLRAIQDALEYFGGLPKTILSDRMKSVLVSVEDGMPSGTSVYADFLGGYRHRSSRLPSENAANKGKGRALHPRDQRELLAGIRFADRVTSMNRPWHGARRATSACTARHTARPVERH